MLSVLLEILQNDSCLFMGCPIAVIIPSVVVCHHGQTFADETVQSLLHGGVHGGDGRGKSLVAEGTSVHGTLNFFEQSGFVVVLHWNHIFVKLIFSLSSLSCADGELRLP